MQPNIWHHSTVNQPHSSSVWIVQVPLTVCFMILCCRKIKATVLNKYFCNLEVVRFFSQAHFLQTFHPESTAERNSFYKSLDTCVKMWKPYCSIVTPLFFIKSLQAYFLESHIQGSEVIWGTSPWKQNIRLIAIGMKKMKKGLKPNG